MSRMMFVLNLGNTMVEGINLDALGRVGDPYEPIIYLRLNKGSGHIRIWFLEAENPPALYYFDVMAPENRNLVPDDVYLEALTAFSNAINGKAIE